MIRACAAAGFVLVAGCDSGPRPLDWTYRFEPAALAEATRAIEARILHGGCLPAALPAYGVVFARGAESGMAPPPLAPGQYGFDVRALDATCTRVAHGCVPVALPLGARQLSVVLEPPDATPPPCAGSCLDGFCAGALSADAGPGAESGPFPCGPGRNDCDGDESNGCESDGPCTCGVGTPPRECHFYCSGACEARCEADCEVVCPAGEDCAVDCGPHARCELECGAGNQVVITTDLRRTFRCSDPTGGYGF